MNTIRVLNQEQRVERTTANALRLYMADQDLAELTRRGVPVDRWLYQSCLAELKAAEAESAATYIAVVLPDGSFASAETPGNA